MGRGQISASAEPPSVIGSVPLKVGKRVTDAIIRSLRDQLSGAGRSINIKAIRFIPSTRTDTGTGSFQVVANTVFEVTTGSDSPPRPEALDFVVTVGKSGRAQTLEQVSIPGFRRAAA